MPPTTYLAKVKMSLWRVKLLGSGMTEDEFAALVAIKGLEVDVCWDNHTQLWSGIVLYPNNNFFTESHNNRKRLLHELAVRTLGEAYDGKGITSANN